MTRRGFAHDREWMVVRPDGTFLTQREAARLALVEPVVSADALELRAPDHMDLQLEVKLPPGTLEPCEVEIWGQRCPALDMGPEAAVWFSEFLGFRVRLVRHDPRYKRLSDPAWTGDVEAENAFSDGFPLLVISEESLADLNARIGGEPLPMDRFRPNLVIAGAGAYAEDRMESLTLGAVTLRPVKPCTRCRITTTDQATAAVGVEPLQTLAGYRRDEQLDGVTFGQNAIITHGIGRSLRVGMSVQGVPRPE